MSRIVIVGAGINGVTSAITLKKRGHSVILIDPGPLPHPLAASTDISKAVRSTYGSDEDYTAMAERSIQKWKDWNKEFGVQLYHRVGMMFLRRDPMQPGDFEYESLEVANRRGARLARIDEGTLTESYPAWKNTGYRDGVLEPEAGYVESSLVVNTLLAYAKQLGVDLRPNCQFARLNKSNGSRVGGVVLASGDLISADTVVMATGAWTPYLLPLHPKVFPCYRTRGVPFQTGGSGAVQVGMFPRVRSGHLHHRLLRISIESGRMVKLRITGRAAKCHPGSLERIVSPEEERRVRDFVSHTFRH